MYLLLQSWEPLWGQMNILQHDPATALHSLLHCMIGQLKSFCTSNSHWNRLGVSLFAQLFHLEARIESRSTQKQNRLLWLTWGNSALEIVCIILSALLYQHYFHELLSTGAEFISSEFFYEDEADQLFAWDISDFIFKIFSCGLALFSSSSNYISFIYQIIAS